MNNLDMAARLHSSSIGILRAVRAVDSETGLSAPLLSALSVLVFARAMRLSDLAKQEMVSAPTMSVTVKKLEAAGMVRREKLKGDARACLIEATEQGRKTMLAGREKRLESIEKSIATLDAGEKEKLADASVVFEKIVKQLWAE